ncbi:MAG: hypothetical protein ABW040_09555, partial [Microbacteriaceae bacterium]
MARLPHGWTRVTIAGRPWGVTRTDHAAGRSSTFTADELGGMAPEQYEGTGDARIDQFAFCVAMYEALFGRRPFDAADSDKMYARIVSGVPP